MRSLRLSVLLLGTLLLLSACNFSDLLSDTNSTDTTYTVTDTSTTTTDTTTPTVSVFASDFADVCNGVPLAQAAAYSDTTGIHAALLFDRESSTDSYYQKSFTLPEAWEKPWEQAVETELVTCVTTVPKEFAESCPFDGDTGASYTLNTYSADYTVELYSAQDGKQLATTTISLPADECPSFHYFTDSTENAYPDYKQSLTDFLKPYVQK